MRDAGLRNGEGESSVASVNGVGYGVWNVGNEKDCELLCIAGRGAGPVGCVGAGSVGCDCQTKGYRGVERDVWICIDGCFGSRIIDGAAARVDAPEVVNRVIGATGEGRAEGDGAALVVIGDGIDGDGGGCGVGEVLPKSDGRIRVRLDKPSDPIGVDTAE